jgi:hypothetical protein
MATSRGCGRFSSLATLVLAKALASLGEGASSSSSAAAVPPPPPPLVGILYSTWHGALGANKMNAAGYGSLGNKTVEWLISNQSPSGPTMHGLSTFYHATPQLGFYCIYRRRPGEGPPDGGECPICPVAGGAIPACCRDCANVEVTLEAHAKTLLAAGIDYIATDATNLAAWPSNESDIIQLRPTEVLFEEWHRLRLRGVQTPRIVVWNCVPPGAALYQQYLDRIYNNVSYADLLLKNPRTGNKVFAVPAHGTFADPSNIAKLEDNGGRKDIDVIQIWADNNPQLNQEGVWNFFAPCGGDHYTTSVSTLLECGQLLTRDSVMGSAMAASPSYQVGAGASMPFGSPGKLAGLTLKLMFATVLAAMPDNIFLSSFNELLAGPSGGAPPGAIPLPQGHPTGFTNSAGNEWWAPHYEYWVDSYGSWRSRDMEPTEEYGTLFMDITRSCLNVMRANHAAGTTGCNATLHPTETCCDINGTRDHKPIWSLATWRNRSQFLLTASQEEREVLTIP